MLTLVMEHGLEVMEAVPVGGTRREKKAVRAACDELEAALERVDAEQATQLAEQCEAQQLAQLRSALEAIHGLQAGVAGVKSVQVVRRLLAHCNHAVLDLKRVQYGCVKLGTLLPGAARLANEDEVRWAAALLGAAGPGGAAPAAVGAGQANPNKLSELSGSVLFEPL